MRTGFIERLILLSAIVFYVFLGFLWFPLYVDTERTYGKGDPIPVVVPAGLNGFQFARTLQAQGVVDDARALARWFVRLGMDRDLKPGGYSLRPGSPWEVARQLQMSSPVTVLRTLVPGTCLTDLSGYVEALSEKSNFPEPLRPFLPEDPISRAVFLLPDSYRLVPGTDEAPQLVRAASSAWWRFFGGRVVPDLGPAEIAGKSVLASIVEKEAGLDEERARIAGVFQNRLEKGMPLQSCATVVFAWRLEGRDVQALSRKDLEISSPYNTYRNRGLPSGPICVPSKASWEAVFLPENTPYLFFVARGDGSHTFSRTYGDHLKAKKAAGQ